MFFLKRKTPVDPKLLHAAKNLKSVLLKYIDKEHQARLALQDLEPLINGVISQKIKLPVKDVPRSHDFHEGDLRKYPELEEAYASFSFLIQGFDEKELDDFMKEVDEGKYDK